MNYSYEYTNVVTNSSIISETLKFIVPSDGHKTLYYNWGNHSGMGGEIIIYD